MDNEKRDKYINAVTSQPRYERIVAVSVSLYYLEPVKRSERQKIKQEQHNVYRTSKRNNKRKLSATIVR